jgi:hypothetical protein
VNKQDAALNRRRMDAHIVRSREVRAMLSRFQKRYRQLPNVGELNYFLDSRPFEIADDSINRPIKHKPGENIEKKAVP